MDVRRIIGVGAFVYAATHISLYVADQMFDLWKVVSEIALRLYLTIGFTALLGLTALAITSTDGMVRRLGGKNWQRLHNIIYGIGLLALIHYFQQTKADVSVPTFVAGLFAWMLGYRLLLKFRKTRDEPPAWMLLALSAVVAALVFIAEAIGIGIVFNVSPFRVLRDRIRLRRPQHDPARLAGARRGADRGGARSGSGALRPAPYTGARYSGVRPAACVSRR